ncbi:ABC transporter permease [Parabacteroides sp. OttesenSCG-928-G06]|nr:ABC transporter permease [Parabacteroides sp. OttesenSCG-928-K15]MDL2281656.1 ABC transporter permease [Parabacteroides sp. OttesenSCG-928-G06]
MIRYILKQLWKERKSNAWLLAELILVGAFIFYVTDRFMIDYYTYFQPKGFDVSHTYRIKMSDKKEGDRGFVAQETSTEAEDLQLLVQRLKQMPEIENASISYWSCFYSRGNSRRNLIADDGIVHPASDYGDYNYRRVTHDFFDVSRVYSEDGKPFDMSALSLNNAVVITSDIRDKLFPDKQAVGKTVLSVYGTDTARFVVAGVTGLVRNSDYEKADPCIFQCLTGPVFVANVKMFGAANAELIIRVKPEADRNFRADFTKKMGDRLTVNNLYVSGVEAVEEMRNSRLNYYWKEQKTDLSLFAFVLLNIFFGIIATFWLRTGYRQGEMGLRMALGSDRKGLFSLLFLEGLCLLLLTVIPVVLITVNLFYLDYMDTFRLPFGIGRLLTGLGIAYLFMFIMIALGIWYPAQRSARVQPAEALHYE